MPNTLRPATRRRPFHRLAVCVSGATLLAGSLLPVLASAGDRVHRDDRFRAFGRVIDVRPVYGEVAIREPVRRCSTEYRRPPRHGHRDSRVFRHDRDDRRHYRGRADGTGGAIVGGVIGGVVGNRIARHHRSEARVASTIAGAVIGSTIGHGVARERWRHGRDHRRPGRHDRHYRGPVERCYDSVTVRYETRLQHYDITYVLRGRTFHTTRLNDPGDRIEIDVSRRPSER